MNVKNDGLESLSTFKSMVWCVPHWTLNLSYIIYVNAVEAYILQQRRNYKGRKEYAYISRPAGNYQFNQTVYFYTRLTMMVCSGLFSVGSEGRHCFSLKFTLTRMITHVLCFGFSLYKPGCIIPNTLNQEDFFTCTTVWD